ncbi:MAG: DUF7405 family protein, partial [Candidatus Dormibacteraceae bacterium]
ISPIQIDIGNFIPRAQFPQHFITENGLNFGFGPVFTMLAPVKLTRPPTAQDRQILETALLTIEQMLPMSPLGIFTFVSYGIPYFQKLEQAGMPRQEVLAMMPKLLDRTGRATNRPVLEEAVPGPTDVSPNNPQIKKEKFNQPVAIEQNDMLFTFRSDVQQNLLDVLMWLNGSNKLRGAAVPSPAFKGLLQFQAPRLQFQQPGLPRKVAVQNKLPYATQINPNSPMWMGFADQHSNASGPPPIVTFQGNATAKLTTAKAGDYFANGCIQHLSHVILDLEQFYRLPDPTATDPFLKQGEPYRERVQYMFRSNSQTPLSTGNADQFTDGGGTAFVPNVFQGATDAQANAAGQGTLNGQHRLGHNTCLQRSTRTADGTAVHIRMDGTGFTDLDLPHGKPQPSLEFTIFMPTSEFFRQLRVNAASLDLQESGKVDPHHNGVERFSTCTRRQNFLVPPRLHRSFPLAEALGGSATPTQTAPTQATPGQAAPTPTAPLQQPTPTQTIPGQTQPTQIGQPGQVGQTGASPVQQIVSPATGVNSPSPIGTLPTSPIGANGATQGADPNLSMPTLGSGDDGDDQINALSQIMQLLQKLLDNAGASGAGV